MPQETPTPTRGVQIMLDRVRYMRYSLGTIRKIREEFGVEALEAGLSGDKLAKVLWYGLVTDDPSLTVEQLEELIDLENMKGVLEVMTKALGYRASVSPADPQVPAAEAEGGAAGA